MDMTLYAESVPKVAKNRMQASAKLSLTRKIGLSSFHLCILRDNESRDFYVAGFSSIDIVCRRQGEILTCSLHFWALQVPYRYL